MDLGRGESNTQEDLPAGCESLGEQLPTSVIFDYPSVEALTGYLSGVLPELVEASEVDDADEYDDLSDDELLAQLSERLS